MISNILFHARGKSNVNANTHIRDTKQCGEFTIHTLDISNKLLKSEYLANIAKQDFHISEFSLIFDIIQISQNPILTKFTHFYGTYLRRK